MALPKWTRLLDRSKRQTFTNSTITDNHLDSSFSLLDCSCKARKQVEKLYRYIGKRLDQLEYDKCQLQSEQNILYNKESQLSKSISNIRIRERELDDYRTYLNDKLKSISAMYNKCETLEAQINNRLDEYNSLQRDLKNKLDDADMRHKNLVAKEQQVEKMARDLEMRERELSNRESNIFHQQDYYKHMAHENYNSLDKRALNQCLMEIEHERNKLETDRRNFSHYYENIMEEIDRKWRKLNHVTSSFRDKEEDILVKEKQLLSNRDNIQRAWDEIEEARLDIMKQKELIKKKISAAEAAMEAAMQNSISMQQINNDESNINRHHADSVRPTPRINRYKNDYQDDRYFRDRDTPVDNRSIQHQDGLKFKQGDDQYRNNKEESSVIDPKLQMKIEEKMSDITKLVEDIKQETSLLAMEKYSLQGQKKQFELEKAINERELAAKERHLLNLEQRLRKNELLDQETPTTTNGQFNGYYNDKMRLGDSSTRFTDVEKDIGGFFLDKSTGNQPSSKRLYNSTTELNNMRDIKDYGRI